MPLGRVVQPAHHPVRRLYFPLDCIVALLYLGEDGSPTEVAVVGPEGLTGITAVLGAITSPTHAVVQNPGHALVLDAQIVNQWDDNSMFRTRIKLFALAQMTQIAQTAAPQPPSHHRGSITIADRAGLASAACECYGVITAEYLGFPG